MQFQLQNHRCSVYNIVFDCRIIQTTIRQCTHTCAYVSLNNFFHRELCMCFPSGWFNLFVRFLARNKINFFFSILLVLVKIIVKSHTICSVPPYQCITVTRCAVYSVYFIHTTIDTICVCMLAHHTEKAYILLEGKIKSQINECWRPDGLKLLYNIFIFILYFHVWNVV